MSRAKWISILQKQPPYNKVVLVLLENGKTTKMIGKDVLYSFYSTHWKFLDSKK